MKIAQSHLMEIRAQDLNEIFMPAITFFILEPAAFFLHRTTVLVST